MDAQTKRDQVRKFIEAAGSSFVGIEFLKKDGTLRDARFNPRDFNEVKGTGKKCEDPDIFRFREVQNKEEGKTSWRSFSIARLVRIKANGEEIVFD